MTKTLSVLILVQTFDITSWAYSTPSHREPKPITIWHFSWIFSFRNAKKKKGKRTKSMISITASGLNKEVSQLLETSLQRIASELRQKLKAYQVCNVHKLFCLPFYYATQSWKSNKIKQQQSVGFCSFSKHLCLMAFYGWLNGAEWNFHCAMGWI